MGVKFESGFRAFLINRDDCVLYLIESERLLIFKSKTDLLRVCSANSSDLLIFGIGNGIVLGFKSWWWVGKCDIFLRLTRIEKSFCIGLNWNMIIVFKMVFSCVFRFPSFSDLFLLLTCILLSIFGSSFSQDEAHAYEMECWLERCYWVVWTGRLVTVSSFLYGRI